MRIYIKATQYNHRRAKKNINKNILFFTFILFFMSFQTDNTKKVYWHERNIITWNDFTQVDKLTNKTDIKINGDEAAIISCPINSKGLYYDDDGNLVSEVTTFLNIAESYVINGKQNNHLLKHEQGHFDISELYARKIRKELSMYKFTKFNIYKMFIKISDRLLKESKRYNDEYDRETNHSINKEKQAEWDKKIAQELAELDDYKNVDVICILE